MYSSDDVRKRCATVYDNQVARHRKKLQRSAGVKIEIPKDQVLPYSFQDFFDWVWRQYGARVVKCPHCPALIDFRTMQFDHVMPLERGGSLSLANLQGVCENCNALKGTQTPMEFGILLQFLESLDPQHRKFLEHRIRAGAAANRMRFFPYKKKEDGDKTPKPLAKQEHLNLGGDSEQPIRPF